MVCTDLQKSPCVHNFSAPCVHNSNVKRTPKLTHARSAYTPHMPLTASDRCDRCSAQAFVRFHFPDDQDLQFCRHHSQMYQDTLLDLAIDVEDETHKLLLRSSDVADKTG